MHLHSTGADMCLLSAGRLQQCSNPLTTQCHWPWTVLSRFSNSTAGTPSGKSIGSAGVNLPENMVLEGSSFPPGHCSGIEMQLLQTRRREVVEWQ